MPLERAVGAASQEPYGRCSRFPAWCSRACPLVAASVFFVVKHAQVHSSGKQANTRHSWNIWANLPKAMTLQHVP